MLSGRAGSRDGSAVAILNGHQGANDADSLPCHALAPGTSRLRIANYLRIKNHNHVMLIIGTARVFK
jgi:hypothetical protein